MVWRMSRTKGRVCMFRRSRRGQAAFEYIHTYGWILLTLTMISGVLFYYNISGAEDLLPIDCNFLSGLNCLDAEVDGGYLYLVVVNEFGFALSNVTFNITGTCNSSANTTDGNPFGNLNVLMPNQQTSYVFECQNLTNIKLTERLTVGYRNVESDQTHIKIGKLQHAPDGRW